MAFTHAHAVHSSYGRGTLLKIIETLSEIGVFPSPVNIRITDLHMACMIQSHFLYPAVCDLCTVQDQYTCSVFMSQRKHGARKNKKRAVRKLPAPGRVPVYTFILPAGRTMQCQPSSSSYKTGVTPNISSIFGERSTSIAVPVFLMLPASISMT